jgi:hypothetical protein
MDPDFVILTAYMTNSFRNYLNKLGIDKIYEKPLTKEQLSHILSRSRNTV